MLFLVLTCSFRHSLLISLSDVWVALANTVDGRTTMSLLSSLLSLWFDLHDKASALVLLVPGICLSVKSYSDSSWNSLATLRFIFCGSFQYCRLKWSI